MSKPAQRLRQLVDDGVELSRNRNYELFKNRENRAALNLHRRLDTWCRMLRTHQADDDARLEVSWEDDAHSRLSLHVESLHGTFTIYLDNEELALLRERPGMGELLADV